MNAEIEKFAIAVYRFADMVRHYNRDNEELSGAAELLMDAAEELEKATQHRVQRTGLDCQSTKQSTQADICQECGAAQDVPDVNNIRGGLVCGTCGKCR